MANTIDKLFFIGEVDLPTNVSGTENRLTYFINKYEPKIYTGLLGGELYEAMKVGLAADPVEDRMQKLLRGVPGKWIGFIQGDTKVSIVADYIYFQYISDLDTVISPIGAVKTKGENATRVTGMTRAVHSMTSVREAAEQLIPWLRNNSTYPEFDYKAACKFYHEYIKGINTLNI